MEYEITLMIEVDGTYDRGTEDTFSGGQWLPGDRAGAENLRCYLRKQDGTRIDITECLSESELASVTEWFEQSHESGGAEPEDFYDPETD